MKTVLVTGGVRGIGLAICEAFLNKGYRVCATYSKDEENAKIAREKGIETYKVSVTDEENTKKLFETLKRVDILVNNAGVSLIKQIQDTTINDYEQVFAVNTFGTFLYTREASKLMIAQKSGLIVNISSVWGEVGASCESVYSASISAVLGFTKALAKELGYSGIRVNAISPGVIDTQMNAHFSKEDLETIKGEIPLGRLGKAEEVAKAVLFLEENEYITGVNLSINGGFSL